MRRFRVNVNGNTYDVEVEEVSAVSARPAPIAAPAPAPVAAPAPAPVAAPAPAVKAEEAAPAPKAIPDGGIALISPMPGIVLRTLVADGAKVTKGQAVVVLETMKMENEIVSTVDGSIHFAVSGGKSVNSGDTLAVIS